MSLVENISLKYCVYGHHIRLCPQPHCLTGCRTQDREGQQFHINYQHKVNGQSIEVLAVDILEKSREWSLYWKPADHGKHCKSLARKLATFLLWTFYLGPDTTMVRWFCATVYLLITLYRGTDINEVDPKILDDPPRKVGRNWIRMMKRTENHL